MRGKYFNSLNEVEGILDRFEFFERLQRIINRNKIFWCLMMPKKEVFQTTYHMFVYVTCNEIATFQDMLKFEN